MTLAIACLALTRRSDWRYLESARRALYKLWNVVDDVILSIAWNYDCRWKPAPVERGKEIHP